MNGNNKELPEGVREVELRTVKKGDFFTLLPYSEPTEKQVWVQGEYDRHTKTYSAYRFTDVNHELANGRGDRRVFVGFTF